MPTNTADIKRAIVADAKTITKVLQKTFVAVGYSLGDVFCEVTQGFGRAWIIEIRLEIWRK